MTDDQGWGHLQVTIIYDHNTVISMRMLVKSLKMFCVVSTASIGHERARSVGRFISSIGRKDKHALWWHIHYRVKCREWTKRLI